MNRPPIRRPLTALLGPSLPLLLSCGAGAAPAVKPAEAAPVAQVEAKAAAPTVEQARAFVEETEADLRRLWSYRERIGFVQLTYVNHDTETLAAQAEEQVMEYVGKRAKEVRRFDGLSLPADLSRKLHLLKLSLTLPAPADAKGRAELAQLATQMEATYAKGRYCVKTAPGKGERCLTLDEMGKQMAERRDFDELLELWSGWHSISPPMRPGYARFAELANQGAREQGFADLGALWRSNYDMPPEAFSQEVERLWGQVAPLYQAMHCHVRAKLRERYGQRVPEKGPIPAHLLGNMWAQEWGNVYPLVAPKGAARGADLKAALLAKKTTAIDMVKYGERFFTSMGLDPLPQTFWQRSLFVRPRDRDVMCHASAWDITSQGDLRLKMCIEIDEDNFQTVHHELGHDYYYWYYRGLTPLFQSGAHDGFHEAIGDAVALSITPAYFSQVGLAVGGAAQSAVAAGKADKLDKGDSPTDIALLLRRALDGVAFLPFGKLIDQWRWDVFSGKTKPEDYNKAWWALRQKYQGVAEPLPRGEADFDPGAKYHVPANVPYTRYFLARILQYQFHRALCDAAGYKGPLHRCSVYGNKAAGEKLKALLAMGASRPWPEALEKLTGTRQMDAGALLDYYQPLLGWLNEQNKGRTCGW